MLTITLDGTTYELTTTPPLTNEHAMLLREAAHDIQVLLDDRAWDIGEREADEDIRLGRVEAFPDMDSFLTDLFE